MKMELTGLPLFFDGMDDSDTYIDVSKIINNNLFNNLGPQLYSNKLAIVEWNQEIEFSGKYEGQLLSNDFSKLKLAGPVSYVSRFTPVIITHLSSFKNKHWYDHDETTVVGVSLLPGLDPDSFRSIVNHYALYQDVTYNMWGSYGNFNLDTLDLLYFQYNTVERQFKYVGFDTGESDPTKDGPKYNWQLTWENGLPTRPTHLHLFSGDHLIIEDPVWEKAWKIWGKF